MKNTLIYDFSRFDKALESLGNYLGIADVAINLYLSEYRDNYSVEGFLKNFNIKENKLLENELLLTALHVTTSNNECRDIIKYGLVDLQEAVTIDTLLNRYLEEQQINIIVEEKKVKYRDKLYDISKGFSEMKFNSSDKERLSYEVNRKLYFDPQINAFFSRENVLNYGGDVHQRPEFIQNLAQMLEEPEIESGWKNLHGMQCYVIKFHAPISDYELYTFGIKQSDLQEVDSKEIEIMKRKWVIGKTLTLINDCWCSHTIDETFAYLKIGIKVPPENIQKIYTKDDYYKDYL